MPASRGRASTATSASWPGPSMRPNSCPSDQSGHRLRSDGGDMEIDRRRPHVHGVSRRARRRRLSAGLDQPDQSRHHCLDLGPGRHRHPERRRDVEQLVQPADGAFYHVSTDNAFPYRVCSGQQESGSACISSRGDDGQITFREWSPGGRRGVRLRRARSARSRHRLRRQGVALGSAHRQVQQVGPKPLRDGDYRVVRTMPVLFSPLNPRSCTSRRTCCGRRRPAGSPGRRSART